MSEGMQQMQSIQDIIKQFEGFQAHTYRCPGGYQTIGYGHRIYTNEELPTIRSEDDAATLLDADLTRISKGIAKLIVTPLTLGQHAALLSFTFNVGVAALERATLRHKINHDETLAAADEFPKWCWSRGHKLPGLLKRRYVEQDLFLSHLPVENDFF